MDLFKRKVLKNYLSRLNNIPLVMVGDRLLDSSRRRKLLRSRGIIEWNNYWKQVTVHPIAHWTLSHVYFYLSIKDIPLNPLYFKIGSSGNCVYCPFVTDGSYYKKLRETYPKWFNKVLEAEKAMRNGGGAFLIANKVFKLSELLLGKAKTYKPRYGCYHCIL